MPCPECGSDNVHLWEEKYSHSDDSKILTEVDCYECLACGCEYEESYEYILKEE